jgi:predicted Zn-dependent protease
VSGGPVTINGNRAYLGLYNLSNESGAGIPAVVAFIEYRQRLYQILGPMADAARYRSPIEAAIRSFDRVTSQRILAVQPDHLRIYTARQGDTLDSLADRYANPRVTADDLALLNRLAASQPLTPGRLIKVVEKGY